MKKLLQDIRQDWVANRGQAKPVLVVLSYRVASRLAQRPKKDLVWVAGLPLQAAYRLVVEWVLGVEIPAKTKVGPGLRIFHGQGLVVSRHAVIGKNVLLRNNTTIGNRHEPEAAPTIEDNAEIGANSVLIGPITIGEGAIVGAGSVVLHDVPAGSVAVGNPARVLEGKKD
jgi:putative colanic acid biosynthesis acetyltransferase WcaB